MATYRVQIGFALDSSLPRDVVTINPHYVGDNAQALADALKANIIANANVGASAPFTIKVYDAAKAPPSFPIASATNPGTPLTSGSPREVCLCLSYYSVNNRPSTRGRLYIPYNFIGGSMGIRPTTTQRSTCLNWGNTLGKGLPSNHQWAVYSHKLGGTGAVVTNTWVDDEWDIQRSRGLKPTTRTLGTIP